MDKHQIELMKGIRNGRIDIIERAIAEGADINKHGSMGDSPLMAAIRARKPSTIDWLLAHGAQIDRQNTQGYAALHVAAQQGDLTSIEKLCERGADIDIQTLQKETPLFLAAYVGDPGAVSALLAHGARTDIINIGGLTALDIVHGKQSRDLITDARNIEIGNGKPDLALMQAVKAQDLAQATTLLEQGANPDSDANNGQTCLIEALKTGNLEMTGLLLLAEASPNKPDKTGNRPIHAALDAPVMALPLLTRYGAAINATSNGRTTALHDAAKKSKCDHVDMLLTLGANPLHKDLKGRKAIDLAANTSDGTAIRESLGEQMLQQDLKNAIHKWRNGGDNPGQNYRKRGMKF